MRRPKRNAGAALLLLAALLSCTSNPPPGVSTGRTIALPFIENDYAQALTRARQAQLPIFVEVWAPW